MKKLNKSRLSIIFTIFFIFILTSSQSCKTIVKDFQNKDGTNYKTTRLLILKDQKNSEWMELSSKLINPIILLGKFRYDNGENIEFNIDTIKFLVNWENGWIEGEGTVNAKLFFYKENNYYRCKVIENLEFFEITKGSLRYLDDFYYGEKGLNSVKNRYDRISFVNDFLQKEKDMPKYFLSPFFKIDGTQPYKQRVEKLLFPELFFDSVIYKSKEYQLKDISSDLVISETIGWNVPYTKKNFPEDLQMVRDSGTMYRDFEETVELFFANYNLKYFFDEFITNERFYLK